MWSYLEIKAQRYPKPLLRPTGIPVRLKNPDYLGLKSQTLPDHSLKKRWDMYTNPASGILDFC